MIMEGRVIVFISRWILSHICMYVYIYICEVNQLAITNIAITSPTWTPKGSDRIVSKSWFAKIVLMHVHPLYISLEVKDNQNNSPQFWMIQIPYLKDSV